MRYRGYDGDYDESDDGYDTGKPGRAPAGRPSKKRRKDNQRALVVVAVVIALALVYGVRNWDAAKPVLKNVGHLIVCNLQNNCPTGTVR
jgi:hypothetical protein